MNRDSEKEKAIWAALEEVPDPEVPVLSVVELGIIREVRSLESGVEIVITPTYSGCPAMSAIEAQIRARLAQDGIAALSFETTYAPPWTTDWMSAEAKEKLRAYGIAPPLKAETETLVPLPSTRRPIACPFCGSHATELKSEFGSTACKALMFCSGCEQPFEHFKSF